VLIPRCLVDMAAEIFKIATQQELVNRSVVLSTLHATELAFCWGGISIVCYFHTKIFAHMAVSVKSKIDYLNRLFGISLLTLYVLFMIGTYVALIVPDVVSSSFDSQTFYFALIGVYTLILSNVLLFFGIAISRYAFNVNSDAENQHVIRRAQRRILLICFIYWSAGISVCALGFLVAFDSSSFGNHTYIIYTIFYASISYVVLMCAFAVFNVGLGTKRFRELLSSQGASKTSTGRDSKQSKRMSGAVSPDNRSERDNEPPTSHNASAAEDNNNPESQQNSGAAV